MMRLMFVALVVAAISGVSNAQSDPTWRRVVPSATVKLRDAQDLSLSAEGLLYVADTGNHRVLAVDTSGKVVAETGGFGAAHGQFEWPRAVVANRGNAVWILDFGNRRIEKFTRLLEYQGTLQITVAGDETPHQAQAMAISPQGDVYVFDRDAGALIRFDPLFNQQAELGSGSGSQFISNITAMTFVPGRGLFWWERGGMEIRHSDGLLNVTTPYRLSAKFDRLCLASDDSCLIRGSLQGIFRQCSDESPADTLISAAALAREGLRSVTSVAMSLDGALFLLDGSGGMVVRTNGIRE
jgi:hypothetical protein